MYLLLSYDALSFKRRNREGVDYDETFASTVRFESVRALVALAGSMGWELD